MGVVQGIWRRIDDGEAPSETALTALVADEAPVFSHLQRRELEDRMGADLLGAGPLEELLDEPGVTDVLVNGAHGVWVDRGAGLELRDLTLGDAEDVRRLAVRLAGLAGRRLDDASPYVDAVLPGRGARLHAVLPPLVESGAHISLRLPGQVHLTMDDLVRSGSVPVRLAPVLQGLISCQVPFVISGGTGSGKTTLLGALLGLVPHDQRIVLVEDVRELAVQHPHVVRLEARAPNVEGAGEITLTTLVRQCLRMRPDRVVVGEVRGAEVRELMTALNTGHQGGCGTVHANAPEDVPARFEALGALAGLGPEAVRSQLRSAIRVVVHVERASRGRRIRSVGVLAGDHRGLDVVSAWHGERPGEAWADLCDLTGVAP